MLDDLLDRIGAGAGIVFLHIRKIVGHQTSPRRRHGSGR